jgi:PAS domain S-box-containing protein
MTTAGDTVSFDSLPAPTVVFDSDGCITRCNAAAATLFDAAPDSLVGREFAELFAPDAREGVRAHLAAALTGEAPRRGESFRVLDTERYVDIEWLPHDGDRAWGQVALYDVTNHFRTQRDLRRLHEISSDGSRELDEKIEAMLAVGLERFDLEIAFLSMIDDTFEVVAALGDHDRLTGGATAPLATTYCRRTLDTEGAMVVEDALEEGWEDDIAYRTFGLGCYIGSKVYVDDSTYGTLCFADTDPREGNFTETDRAIVDLLARWAGYEIERKQRELRLRRQNERLEEFTSTVSHDLRNPLTVASGNLELLAEDLDDERIDTALEALERQERLIDNMLETARQGELVTDAERVDLESVVDDAWRSVRTDGAVLSIDSLPTLQADETRLQTLLENLFRNAVEHGPTCHDSHTRQDSVEHGSTDSRIGSDDAELTIEVGPLEKGFYVEDDGVGIPAETREAVFQEGYTTSESGTGLGLAIVERIVRAHGWEIEVMESADGGARFEIRLQTQF